MHAVTIEIPETLTEAIAGSVGELALPRWALEAIVMQAVGDGLITTGQMAEILQLSYFETLALLKQRHVVNNMNEDELRTGEADLKKMFPDLFAE